jgi:hypothetical protein
MLSRKKLLIGLLTLAVIGAFAFTSLAQGQKTAKQPTATIAKTTVNLGDVIEGQDIEYTFDIKNGGDAELQILSVRPG